MFMLKVPKEMLIRGKRRVVIQSVEDDGFPENLATAKQKMVKRGENTSYLGQNTKVSENFFSGKIRVNSAKGRPKRSANDATSYALT